MALNLKQILFQSALRSKVVRENFTDTENAINDLQAQIDALSTPATGSETVNARDYHSVLRDRLRSASESQGNVLISGGAVTQQGTPDMTVAVALGEALVDGVACKWSAQNSGTITAPTTNPRFDVVVINSDNSLSVVTGTESATPSLPPIANTQTALARLTLIVSQSSITTSDILLYVGIPTSQIGEIIALHPDTKSDYLPNLFHYSPCDGVELLDTTYIDSINDTKVPDLTDDRFLMGGTTYNDDSSGTNTIDIEHNHRWYRHTGGGSGGGSTYKSDGIATGTTSTATNTIAINVTSSSSTGLRSVADTDLYTNNAGSTTQDIKPKYFEVLYYMRIR